MTSKPKRVRKRPAESKEVWVDPWPSGSWPAKDAESPSELGQPIKEKRRAKGAGWGYIAAPKSRA